MKASKKSMTDAEAAALSTELSKIPGGELSDVPKTSMTDIQAADLSAQLAKIPGGEVPTSPKSSMTDAEAAALSTELSKIPGGAPISQNTSLPFNFTGGVSPENLQRVIPDSTLTVNQNLQDIPQNNTNQNLNNSFSIPNTPSLSTPLNSQGFVSGLVDLTDNAKKNISNSANEQIGINNKIGDLYQSEADRKQKEFEQEAQIKMQADQAAAQHDAEARSLAHKLAANTIDPDRYWNSKSTGGKVLATIGLALGQLSAGLTHSGINPAMQQMNAAIANDIDSQKENMAQGWKEYDKLHELDNDAGAKARYNDTWRATHYIMGTELVKTQLATMASKTQNAQVKENANNMIQQIDGKQLDARKALGDQMAAEARAKAQAQAAYQAAQAAKIEKLTASAGKDIQDLVLTAKISEADARKQVAGRPQYSTLRAFGILPQDDGTVSTRIPDIDLKGIEGADKKDKKDSELKQLEADQKELQNFKNNVTSIAPSLIEGIKPTSRGNVKIQQSAYEAFVLKQVAKMYKLETGANEPKNLELIKELSGAYLPNGSWEDPQVTLQRMNQLQHDMESNTVGVTGKDANPVAKVDNTSKQKVIIPQLAPHK